ncbi:MAG: SgcJ/EcaC family oxidoreductase [Pyrinomonadaceae bacterium]|nr:SgcJ/EcaC family oxidoreductase [Pyrinomonadaceae bacterium]
MKAITLFIACAVIFVAHAQARQGETSKPNRAETKMMREVRAVLEAQVAAWNRGDIEGFMSGYAQSSDTVFVSGDTLTRGWETVLNRYKKAYDSREKMGVLTFSELEIKSLAKNVAVVTGRWRLKRTADEPHGRFTLILRRTRAGWRIIHDHTS